MNLNRTPNPLNREARNQENENWEKIERKVGQINSSINDLVLESGGDSNLEVVQARGGKPVLNERLNEIEDDVSSAENKIIDIEENKLVDLEQSKANKSDLEELKQQISGITINDLTYPLYIAHRGAKNIYPENSIEAFRYCVDAGFPIEFDVFLNADGVPVISHDATMNRTTNKNGAISNYSTAGFTSAKITELGTYEGTPTTLEDMFREFGNKAIYVIEPKDRVSPQVIVDLIEKYSLQDNVIYQSFTRADLNPAISAGLYNGYLLSVPISNVSQLKADGVDFVNLNKTQDESFIQECMDAELDVYIFTINRRYEAEHFLGLGIKGVITDDPYWISGKSKILSQDNFNQQTWYHGQISPPNDESLLTNGDRGKFHSPAKFGWQNATSSNNQNYSMQGWAGELSQRFELSLDIIPTELSSGGRWAGVAFCTQNDYYDDSTLSTHVSGYNVIFRQDGRMQLYKKVNGAANLIDTKEVTEMIVGTKISVKIIVNGDNIKVERTDSQASGLSISINDSTFRKGYLHLGRRDLGVTFENIKYNILG